MENSLENTVSVPSKEFALAVVASSSENLTPEEKLNLYIESYLLAKETKKIHKAKVRQNRYK